VRQHDYKRVPAHQHREVGRKIHTEDCEGAVHMALAFNEPIVQGYGVSETVSAAPGD
jgi:hypothetical protein